MKRWSPVHCWRRCWWPERQLSVLVRVLANSHYSAPYYVSKVPTRAFVAQCMYSNILLTIHFASKCTQLYRERRWYSCFYNNYISGSIKPAAVRISVEKSAFLTYIHLFHFFKILILSFLFSELFRNRKSTWICMNVRASGPKGRMCGCV